jgi:Phage P22-like portal protein
MADEQSSAAVHRTEEEREFAAITEADIWTEARDRLQISTQAESKNRPMAKEALAFREGDQWDKATSTTISEDEPELTINLTDALCMRVENNIRQQRPRGKCHPVGDGADVEMAEIINGIGRHVETRSEASVAYDMAARQALTAGWGYFRIHPEYVSAKSFQKDLRIIPIRNLFTVNMDPGAIMPSGADQQWCLISAKMRREEYRRRYPKQPAVAWEASGTLEGRLDWEDAQDIRLAEYFRIRHIPMRLYLIRGGGGEEFTKYQNELPRDPATGQLLKMEEVEEMLAGRGLKIDGDRESSKMQVEWFRLNGLRVVEREQLPGSYIPVFRVEDRATDIDGEVLRRGMVQAMMDPQRMVNYGEVAKIKRLGLAPKAPWVGAEGSFDNHPEWDDANLKPYNKLEYKPVVIETSQGPQVLPPPQRQPPAQIEAGFSEFVQGMRSNLMGVAGAANEPGQDQQGGMVVSGRAIDRRQFLSDQSHFHIYDNLTLAIAQCWRVMLEWIPEYFWEAGRIQRVIGEDSQPQMVEINKPETDENGAVQRIKNDLSVGRYDVVMDTGAGYETKRAEGADNLIDMMKVPGLAEIVAKVGPDLVFRSIDHPYMQELADRLAANTPEGLKKVLEGLSSRAKSLVTSLSNDNAQLKQQLQQLQTDLKYGLSKQQLIEATKVHDSQVAATTKTHDTITRADTEHAMEVLRMAGKMIDSGAARGHEAGMFEAQIFHDATQAAADRAAQAPAAPPAAPPPPTNGSGQ